MTDLQSLPPVVDLFSGCGGMSLGFEEAGFTVLAGYDNWDKAVETYTANFDHPGHLLDLGDVEATLDTLRPFFTSGGPAPMIVGGPPCQDFSSAGGRKEGDRAQLTQKFAHVVAALAPSAFVMENVPASRHSRAYAQAMETLAAAGYHVDGIVLDAAYCGVPQSRKRLFTVGTFSQTSTRAALLHMFTGKSASPMTVRDWFGDSLDTEFYYRHPRSYARRGIFTVNEPSPTIRGVNRPMPATYQPHPGDAGPVDKTRPLTTRERASIQTFPDSFQLPGVKTHAEQMVGNAVPPKLAKYVAEALAQAL